ncbi:hypothetical protein BDZ94DRAFT_1270999 [Collybia nuda]|uniref:Uncharacterized protein n=1 Tax=Collybia nuda TaxID=64659 RepID=A0A9P6CET9_9AGAR|nr:hypothetical protein BDZ94DRAFT_1270999 [Collybia nuda]
MRLRRCKDKVRGRGRVKGGGRALEWGWALGMGGRVLGEEVEGRAWEVMGEGRVITGRLGGQLWISGLVGLQVQEEEQLLRAWEEGPYTRRSRVKAQRPLRRWDSRVRRQRIRSV